MNRAWIAFWILGFIWGSSFLLIRIGVEELPIYEVIFIRVTIAAIGLSAVVWLRGKHFPTDWDSIRALLLVGFGNTVIPFMLITWAEQHITSGLAAVLQATASLFAMVMAHYAFADERMTRQRIAGFVVGFVGVAILASRNIDDGILDTNALAGQFAMILASFFYGLFTTYSRKVISDRMEPIVLAAGAMNVTALYMGGIIIGMLLFVPRLGGEAIVMPQDMAGDVLFAVVMLGLLNTFFAYMLYYSVVRDLGAARAQMVTYIVPPVGLALGVIFKGEVLDVRLLIGAVLILGGIGVVNLRWQQIAVASSRRAFAALRII